MNQSTVNDMKIFLLLAMLVSIISCKKAELQDDKSKTKLSYVNDSSNQQKGQSDTFPALKDRTIDKEMTQNIEDEKDQIIDWVEADDIPITIHKTFDRDNQKLLIKIKNYKKSQLNASILPVNDNMNIRFNQIKTPNGKFDGPFTRKISYKIQNNGEVWLIIGKNNMADGSIFGDFSVTIE